MLRLAVGLVLAGMLLAWLRVPYAGVLVILGVIAFLWWIFTEGEARMR